MDYRKLTGGVILVLLIVVAGLNYIRGQMLESSRVDVDITDLSPAYRADEEIAAAEKKLAEDVKTAEVITTLQDGSARVAIVFDGLPEYPLAQRIVDVLKKHESEAVFFVEGYNAVDQPETIKFIRDAGMELGNYTLAGVNDMEKLPQEEILFQLCHTQKIIQVLSGFEPELFRAPHTAFTDPLLQCVLAAGIPYAVKENVRYQPRTLPDQAQADAWVQTVPWGSIIAIPISRPVDQKAQSALVDDERPAVDMQPTIKDEPLEPPRRGEDLADELDRMLTAFRARGVQIVFVNQFRKIHYIPATPLPLPATQQQP